MSNKHTVAGLEFEAVRHNNPIPHWRLKLPNGSIWEPGVAGIKGESKPKMWESLQYLADRIGHDRFVSEIESA